MSMRRTPPLSLKGSREVLEEMSKPPADTPERRATSREPTRCAPWLRKRWGSLDRNHGDARIVEASRSL